MTVRVGSLLYGFCGGHFGRDSYSDKRVEALGADWVVVRDSDGDVLFSSGQSVVDDLEKYTKKPQEEDL